MSKALRGRTALVTGGNSGIGFATAQRFIAEGAQVIIMGRNQDAVDKAVALLGEAAHGVCCDVSDADSLAAGFKAVRMRFDKLNVLFVNAGVVEIEPLSIVTAVQYNKVFDTCLRGTILTVQHALPLMSEGGSIILNGATIASKGIPGLGLNAAAKSAVRSLGRTLAAELGAKNIRVNTVSPGTIQTPLLQKSGMPKKAIDTMNSTDSPIPLKRIGRADEVAAAVLFLASDESSYITGIDLPVDGGAAQI